MTKISSSGANCNICSFILSFDHKWAEETRNIAPLLSFATAAGFHYGTSMADDFARLPVLLRQLRQQMRRLLLFCDDLSFDREDTSYKSLKAALEGGIEGRPPNVLFYATSNRRHMMPRDMMENERSTAINPSEAVEEKVSLSDRFGLWLGFHHCGQDEYLAMVSAYAQHFGLPMAGDELRERAITWSATRGGRSGRVAWQLIQDIAGELKKKIG